MIYLCPVEAEDEWLVLGWLNDPEICKYNSHGVFPAKPFEPDPKTLRLGIYSEELLGVISLQGVDWIARSAELAILIGDGHQGKGIGKQAVKLICRHGFDQMNLHRIYLGTHQGNIGMQKVAEAVGMTFEGRSRQAIYKDGQYADAIHYGLLKEEFHHGDLGVYQGQPLPDNLGGSQGAFEGH